MATKLLIQQSTNGEWVLMDGDLTISRHATEDEAFAAKKVVENEDAINETIEDAIFELKSDLAAKFKITRDQAHRAIRDFVN